MHDKRLNPTDAPVGTRCLITESISRNASVDEIEVLEWTKHGRPKVKYGYGSEVWLGGNSNDLDLPLLIEILPKAKSKREKH